MTFAPRRVARAFAALIALPLALPAAARGPDFAFPAEVAGFVRGPRTDYESRAPGFGSSVIYTNGRWKADVYVYDLGQAGIPDGPSSPAVRAQVEQAGREIGAMVQRGLYRGSEDKGPVRLKGAGGRALTCRAFAIDHRELGATDSLLCLTGLRGQFVKFRLSAPTERQPRRAEAERFIADWLARQ